MAFLEKHSEVSEALDMVFQELAEEQDNLCKAGAAELLKQNTAPALKAIEFSDRLKVMVERLKVFRGEWSKYIADIDAVAPEMKDILRWQKPTAERVVGQRVVEEVRAWTALSVTFADGTIIQEHRAKKTFAKAIAKLGVERVAKLAILSARQPLVAIDRSSYDGPVTSLEYLDGGWSVKTDFSNDQKKRYLEGIAKALGVKLEVEVLFPDLGAVENSSKDRSLSNYDGERPRIFRGDGWSGCREVAGIPKSWKVSEVVQTWFPILFSRNLLSDEEMAYLTTCDSSEIFKTGGRPVLLVNRGQENDRYFALDNGDMHSRYYPSAKITLTRGNDKYFLSSQFMPPAMGPLIHFLELKGIPRNEIVREVEKFRS